LRKHNIVTILEKISLIMQEFPIVLQTKLLPGTVNHVKLTHRWPNNKFSPTHLIMDKDIVDMIKEIIELSLHSEELLIIPAGLLISTTKNKIINIALGVKFMKDSNILMKIMSIISLLVCIPYTQIIQLHQLL